MFSRTYLAVAIFSLSLLAATLPIASAQTDTEPKRVLATFTVIADIAENVAGDALIVDSITKIGAEIHDYEPTPSDIVRAQSADLILDNGLGLERWFEKFMGSVRDVPTVVVSEGIEPISIAEGPYQDKPNPHAWMSLSSAKIYVENIRKAFVELDPANEEKYNANAEEYIAQFQPLQDQLTQQLSAVPENQRALVSCEGAFSYFARDAGMKEIYLWAINSDQEGTPQQVASVIDRVRQDEIPVVFCESTVNAKAMEQVANETGAAFSGTLYVDSLTALDGDAPTYLDMLKYNTDSVVNAYKNAALASR